MARHAWGVGLATIAADGTTLDTFYRHLGWGDAAPAGTPVESKAVTDERRGVVASWSFERAGKTRTLHLYDCKHLR